MVAVTVAAASACGSAEGQSESHTGGETSDSDGRTTSASESLSGGFGESESGDVSSGSASDSATNTGDATTSASMSQGSSTEDPTDSASTSTTTSGTGDTDDTDDTDDTNDTEETATDSTGDSEDTGDEPLPACNKSNSWTLDADFDQGLAVNVHHDAPTSDQLQISIDDFWAPKPYMFVAQTDEGRVLKIDTVTGKQVARYPSLLLEDCPSCNINPATWKPSRISIDMDGDMYVANRAFSVQGAITKIAGAEDECVDRDGDGQISTSHDANDDGIIDVNDPAEYKGQDDECLLYSFPVGPVNGVLRAFTLDGQGHAYVGSFNENAAYKLDVTQSPPVILEKIALTSRPYGFAVRGDYLYHPALNWAPTSRFDMAKKTGVNLPVLENYGGTVDSKGIAWYGTKFGLARCDYDDPKNSCDITYINDKIFGVTVDHYDQIWGTSLTTIYKFDNSGALLGSTPLVSGYGVSIGHDGHPRVIGWHAVHKVEAGPKGGPPGAATQYWHGHMDGVGAFNYTYTDFTGFMAHNVSVKVGQWSVIHDGGEFDAAWGKVPYNTEPEGKVPDGTTLTVEVRASNTLGELGVQPWIPVVDGAVAEPVVGRLIELRARLRIDDPHLLESPVLSDLCVLRAGVEP